MYNVANLQKNSENQNITTKKCNKKGRQAKIKSLSAIISLFTRYLTIMPLPAAQTE